MSSVKLGLKLSSDIEIDKGLASEVKESVSDFYATETGYGEYKGKKKAVSLKGKTWQSIRAALKDFEPREGSLQIEKWAVEIIEDAVDSYTFQNDLDYDNTLENFLDNNRHLKNIDSIELVYTDEQWFISGIKLGKIEKIEAKHDVDTAVVLEENSSENLKKIKKLMKDFKITEKMVKIFIGGLSIEEFCQQTYDDINFNYYREKKRDENIKKGIKGNRQLRLSRNADEEIDNRKKKEAYHSGIKVQTDFDAIDDNYSAELKRKAIQGERGALVEEDLSAWLLKVIENVAEGKKKRIQTDAIKRQRRAKLNADLALKKAETVKRINQQTRALMATFTKLAPTRTTLNPSVMSVRTGAKPLSLPSLNAADIKDALGADTLLVRSLKQSETKENGGTKKMSAEVSFTVQPKKETDMYDFYRFTPLIVSACQTIKGKFDLMYGCIMMAAYFQILAANTPIDEDYTFKVEELSAYKKKTDRVKEGRITQIKTYIKTKRHEADRVSVRGDWVLSFRGKTFKAFDSEPEEGSVHVSPDVYFGEEFFDKGVDTASMMRMAEIIMDATGKDFNVKQLGEMEKEMLDPTQCVTNINPRWQILETGGYNRNPAALSPRKGTKYGLEHGTKGGFTYQAPRGFVRLTNALWSELSETGKWADIVQSFVSGKQNKVRSMISLDVKDTSSPLVKRLMKRDRSIGRAGFAQREIGGGK